MKILALEFSSPQRSVAVVQTARAGPPVRASWQAVLGGPDHRSAEALGLVEAALQGAQFEREEIECLAIGLGPGSYTGIRAAIALAQGWQLARGARLVGLSSSECVATQAQAEGLSGRVAVVIDAQRHEFYLAGYEIDATGWREVAPLRLVSLAEVRDRQRAGGVIIGPEVKKWFPENGRVVFPHAAALGRLAAGHSDFVAGDKLEPIYLRETQFVKAPQVPLPVPESSAHNPSL
jgi:tRNA threonylcarbamoyl adenosine modification protein YeaZ